MAVSEAVTVRLGPIAARGHPQPPFHSSGPVGVGRLFVIDVLFGLVEGVTLKPISAFLRARWIGVGLHRPARRFRDLAFIHHGF